MYRPSHICAGMIATLLSTTALTASGPADVRIERVESGLLPIATQKEGITESIEDRMSAYGVPGLSIAVVENGRLAWAKGYGVADTGSGRPVTTTTLFQAASISKPVSAMGVLLLVQHGLLNLDDDVNGRLKAWKIPQSGLTRDHAVTVRMLLNHTAGLGHHMDASINRPFAMGEQLPTTMQILLGKPPARVGPIHVIDQPGKNFQYSAAGYEVLQQLTTEISGKPFESYMQAAVFKPLGMTNSTFAQPLPDSLLAVAASGHYAGGQVVPGRFRVSPELTVAGLWTTPTDIARYIVSVQQSYEGSAAKPLHSNLAHEMLTPGLGQRGLGPAISGAGNSARFGHDGFNEGFESTFAAYMHQGRGAVVMTNSGFSFMLIKEILDSISRVYEWPNYGPTTQQPPGAMIKQQSVIPVPQRTLAAASGHYKLGYELVIDVYSRGNRLLMNWRGSGVAEVFATTAGQFFCPQLTFSDVGSPWLQLVESNDGTITSILAAQGSVEFQRMN